MRGTKRSRTWSSAYPSTFGSWINLCGWICRARLLGTWAVNRLHTCPARSLKACDLLFWLLEVKHPVDTELIREHPKSSAPECILERHRDLASFAESREDFLQLFRTLRSNADGKISSLRER